MNLLENNFLIVIAITLLILVVLYFFLGNFHWKQETDEKINSKEPTPDAQETPVSEIFHLYKHESEKHWAEWINKQNHETKYIALQKLVKHINERPEKWGYVTLEILESLKAFKDQAPGSYVVRFISLAGNFWRDYESIPNYYQKALEVLIYLEPELAYKICKEEIDKKSNSEISVEKKRIIINLLPELGTLSTDLFTELLSSGLEISGVRYQALRNCVKLPDDMRKVIYLSSLKILEGKYREIKKVPKLDDINFLEDLIEDSLCYIGTYDFYRIIDELCHNELLTERILTPILTKLNRENSDFTLIETYALSLLKDTKQNEIKKLLGRKNDLEFTEINNLVSHEYIKEFSEADLQDATFKCNFPIPLNLKDNYKDFKNQLSKTVDDLNGRVCEKQSGALLVYGNDSIRKLYFARSLVSEKNWGFAFIDIEHYLTNNLYQDFHNEILTLPKPYLLYLRNIHLLIDEGNQINPHKEKFIRTLSIQGMDSKAMFIGDIPFTFKELEQNNNIKNVVKILCSKFFPNIMEMSINDSKIKIHVIEDFLKNIKPGRIERKKELLEELLVAGETMDLINFSFFITHIFRIILLVFGRDVSYENIKGIIRQFEETKISEAQLQQN